MRLLHALTALAFIITPPMVVAHPLPDIPVRASFDPDGSVTIRVEVDLRCFVPDPEEEAYWPKIFLEKLYTQAERDKMKADAASLITRGVEFFFEPSGAFKPEWVWDFTTLGGGPLVKIDDPVVLTGTWRSKLPAGTTGYSIRANDPNNLAVVFENTLQGKAVERVAVLFPNEKSFTLDLGGKSASAASAVSERAKQTAGTEAPASKPDTKGGGITWWRGIALTVAVGVVIWLAKISRR
jgi:hypothetical protein